MLLSPLAKHTPSKYSRKKQYLQQCRSVKISEALSMQRRNSLKTSLALKENSHRICEVQESSSPKTSWLRRTNFLKIWLVQEIFSRMTSKRLCPIFHRILSRIPSCIKTSKASRTNFLER